MAKKGITFYQILVYIAYAYFICFGGFWFYTNYSNEKHFNYIAFTIVMAFAIQFYFKNKLANLILGIIALSLSIWMLLEVFSQFNLFAKDVIFDGLVKILLVLSITSIIMSGILIFSYMMLNKEVME